MGKLKGESSVRLAVHVSADKRPDLFQSLDEHVRAGRAEVVRDALHRIVVRGVPAEYRENFANLAWRVNLPELGARVLVPVVQGGGRRKMSPTTGEVAECAACLTRLGALDEAAKLLDGIDGDTFRTAKLYRAFVHIAKWEYAQAIPVLRSFLKGSKPNRYDSLVARVNLASALVYEREHLKAETLLREVLHEASVSRMTLALGVILELTAGNFILRGQYEKARPFLKRARKELEKNGGMIPFLLRKWGAIADFLESPEPRAELLDRVRFEAKKLGHWETIRDCDRFQAMRLKDEALLWRLYFGTPFESYRKRLLRDFGALQVPDEYRWDVGQGHREKNDVRCTFHLGTNEITGKKKPPKIAKHARLLLAVLCSDFYRPFRLVSLHAAVHTGTLFNPVSSRSQMHVAVRRLRVWLKQHRVPLDIVETDGSYRLEATAPLEIVLPRPEMPLESLPVYTLKKKFASEGFSASVFAETLGISVRSAQRLLLEEEKKGILQRIGKGRSTRFR